MSRILEKECVDTKQMTRIYNMPWNPKEEKYETKSLFSHNRYED